MSVPFVLLNGQPLGAGRMSVEEILAKVDTGAAKRDAAKLSAKEPFDVLIVGGGPAGAAAAIAMHAWIRQHEFGQAPTSGS